MNSNENQIGRASTPENKVHFGSKLKTLRESQGLSQSEAASRLNLSSRFIILLENENLSTTGLPPIYLRGYLRSYARLLNLPEKEIETVLEQLDPTPAPLQATPISSEPLSYPLENNSPYSGIATFFISLTLLTSVTTWWYLHSNKTTPAVIAAIQPVAPVPELASIETSKVTIENANTLLNSTSSTPSIAEVALNPQSKETLTLASNNRLKALSPKPLPAPVKPNYLESNEDNDTD